MNTANVNNYVNFLTEVSQKGYVNRDICVKHKINTRTPLALRQLNLIDADNLFISKESSSVKLAKKIIQKNRENYQLWKNKNNKQTQIDFESNAQFVKYNKIQGQKKTEIFKLKLTPQEKQYLHQASKKANKTMSKYVVEKLGLHKIDHNSIVVKQKPTTSKSKNITLFWGLIKITK